MQNTGKRGGSSRPAARAAPPSPVGKQKPAGRQKSIASVVEDCAGEIEALDADAVRSRKEAALVRLATEKSMADPAPAGPPQKNKTREPEETRDPSGRTETLAQRKALEEAQLRAAQLKRDNEVLAQRLKKLEAQSGPGASRTPKKPRLTNGERRNNKVISCRPISFGCESTCDRASDLVLCAATGDAKGRHAG